MRKNKAMLTQVRTITAYQKCYSLLSKDGASAVRLFERGAEREAGEVVRSPIELAIRRGPATVTRHGCFLLRLARDWKTCLEVRYLLRRRSRRSPRRERLRPVFWGATRFDQDMVRPGSS